jgi:Mrp family chromosome partitioning ATPase
MYDYVFIDCPPIDIIADTDIVSQFVDTTIFVIRAGLMERSWLAEINKIYEEQRFNNLCIMLNGTLAGNAYSRHRYGGYYGHYHYGYYYGSKSKK